MFNLLYGRRLFLYQKWSKEASIIKEFIALAYET